MSTDQQEPSDHEQHGFVSKYRRFQIEEAILIILLLLSLGGVTVTNFSAADGYGYWLVMIFVFALFAIILGFFKAKARHHLARDLLGVQAAHWIGTLFTVIASFSLIQAGLLNEQAAGLVILLLLALATFLDGIRLGWRFSIVGIFLGLTAVIIALIEAFMWIAFLLAIVIVAATIMFHKRNTRKAEPINMAEVIARKAASERKNSEGEATTTKASTGTTTTPEKPSDE